MSAEEKESEALRLLAEVAEERHAGQCSLVRVEMRGAGARLLGVLDIRPLANLLSSAASTSLRSVESVASE